MVNLIHRVGVRTLKTGIAVGLASLLSYWVNPTDPFVLIFSALIALESTVLSSLETSGRRLISTIIGGFAALIFSLFQMPMPIAMALSIMVLILISNHLNLDGTVTISGSVTVLVLLYAAGSGNPMLYTINRLRDTFLGLLIALAVNALIAPPNPFQWMRKEEDELFAEMIATIEGVYLYGLSDSLKSFSSKISSLNELYLKAKNEVGLNHHSFNSTLKDFKKLIGMYRRIYIYAENLSLMGPKLRVTKANQEHINEIINHDEIIEADWGKESIRSEEIIYNHTLYKLIEELGALVDIRQELKNKK